MDGRISSLAQLRERVMGAANTDPQDEVLTEAGGLAQVDGVLRHAAAETWRLAGCPLEWSWDLPDDDAAPLAVPPQLHGHLLAIALGVAAAHPWFNGDAERRRAVLDNAVAARAAAGAWGTILPLEPSAEGVP